MNILTKWGGSIDFLSVGYYVMHLFFGVCVTMFFVVEVFSFFVIII